MKRLTALSIAALLLLINVFGCSLFKGGAKKADKPQSPFTTEYKTTNKNIKFFTQGDELELLLAASPFYAGAQPLPGQKTQEYDKLREEKVKEIQKNAFNIVKATDKIKPKVNKLRNIYLKYLTAVYKEEPKLEKYIKEVFATLSASHTKAKYFRDQYVSMDTNNLKNEYAKSLFDYYKVNRAQEVGYLALEDISNIGAFAADTLVILKNHKSPKIMQLNKKLDKNMAAINKLDKEISAIHGMLQSIDHGFKQLATADYYFALETDKYISSVIPDLEAKMKKLKPKKNLTAKQIKFVKGYLKLFKLWQKEVRKQIAETGKGKDIIKLKEKPGKKAYLGIETAFAAGPGGYYSTGTRMLRSKPEPPGLFSKGWDIFKSGVSKIRTGVGVGLDMANVGVKNISTGIVNKIYGVPFSETWKESKQNVKEIFDNYNKGTSGAKVLKTAGEYMEGAGEAAGQLTQDSVNSFVGKESLKGWAAGLVAKTTVGMFTDFAKGSYKLLSSQSTTGDVAEGLFDVATSLIGGSKVILKGSQVPGVAKELAKQGKNTGKLGLTYLGSALNESEIKQLTKELRKIVIKNDLTKEQVEKLVTKSMKLETKEIIGQFIKENRENVMNEMRKALKKGGDAALENLQSGLKESLDEVFKATFEKNYKGILDAIKATAGTDSTKILDNLLGEWTDDFIKNSALEVLKSTPESQELGGTWKGTMKVVNVIVARGADPQVVKGCEQQKGKVLPLTIEMPEFAKPAGSCKITVGKDSVPATFRYSGGKITITGAKSGSSATLSGSVTRVKTGGFTMGGNFTLDYKLVKLTGGWNSSIIGD